MKNNTGLNSSRQDFSLRTSPTADHYGYISNISWGRKKILKAILDYFSTYDAVYVSQETIAKKAEVSREYVNKVIREFESRGLLTWKRRFNKSSIYQLTDVLRDQTLLDQLKHLFNRLFYLPLIILFPFWCPPVQPLSPVHNRITNVLFINKLDNYKRREETMMRKLFGETPVLDSDLKDSYEDQFRQKIIKPWHKYSKVPEKEGYERISSISKPWKAPDLVALDIEEERAKLEEHKNSSAMDNFRAIFGITAHFDVPDCIYERKKYTIKQP